jgi:hypothetical protein
MNTKTISAKIIALSVVLFTVTVSIAGPIPPFVEKGKDYDISLNGPYIHGKVQVFTVRIEDIDKEGWLLCRMNSDYGLSQTSTWINIHNVICIGGTELRDSLKK